MAPIAGALLDSGDVLMRPHGERWFPKPGFGGLLAAAGLALPGPDELDAALAAGYEVLRTELHVPTLAAEADLFRRYYVVVLGELFPRWPADLARRLGDDVVATPDQAPFADVAPALRRLRARGLRLGVVSNAWPSLRIRLATAGLDALLDAVVVSAELGVPKPDPAIYRRALAELAVPAADVLFVDDDPVNVAAARRLGMQAVTMDRYGAAGDVAGLAEVEALVAGA